MKIHWNNSITIAHQNIQFIRILVVVILLSKVIGKCWLLVLICCCKIGSSNFYERIFLETHFKDLFKETPSDCLTCSIAHITQKY